jgi:hypothetical protein
MSVTALLHPTDVRVRRSILGPRLHPARAAYEFYPTPPEATRALLSVESFDGSVWEPACGQGHIAKVLEAAGHSVVATDLAECWGYGMTGRDFLTERTPLARNIITNPPYGRGLADAFCKHATDMTAQTGGKVAMLVAVQSLCHPIRHPFFTTRPPARVYPLDECHCWPYGDASQATKSLKAQRYCWIVWTGEPVTQTTMRWLSTGPFRDELLQFKFTG